MSDVEILKNRFSMDDQTDFIDYIENNSYNTQEISKKISKKSGNLKNIDENKKEAIIFRTIEDIEKDQISKALEYYRPYKNDKDKVANVLGISRATLYRKIKKYNIDIE